jgi:tryptophanase
MAGYDLEAIAAGLAEVTDEDYLRYRIRSVAYSQAAYPAQALAVELYRTGGVRGVEIGSVTFGRQLPDGREEPAVMELVRLALPRRVYTQATSTTLPRWSSRSYRGRRN